MTEEQVRARRHRGRRHRRRVSGTCPRSFSAAIRTARLIRSTRPPAFIRPMPWSFSATFSRRRRCTWCWRRRSPIRTSGGFRVITTRIRTSSTTGCGEASLRATTCTGASPAWRAGASAVWAASFVVRSGCLTAIRTTTVPRPSCVAWARATSGGAACRAGTARRSSRPSTATFRGRRPTFS